MSDESAQVRRGLGEKSRIVFLTDGVFAIVMTLLVLEIRVPEGQTDRLLQELGDLVPEFLVYGLVLVTLGALWFGNRVQTQFMEYADHASIWLTLLMLGMIALVPFSAAVLGNFPSSRVAVVLFGVHLTVVFGVHGLLWLYASARGALLYEWVPVHIRQTRLPSFLPMIGYAFATLLGLAVPIVGLIGFVLVPVPLVAGVFYRGLARVHEGAARY